MKRSLGSSDSLGALMSVCPSTEEHGSGNNHVYGREFQSMMLEGLDEEGCLEESGHIGEKKRRLSVEQVKALEKNFEVENKLEPDRKVKLAQELGLQPRQVAVWFQNRRARWKTKQLERDYGLLKANYDALKLNYDSLQLDNEALLKEIGELKSKLQEENTESNLSVKEEKNLLSESEEKPEEQRELDAPIDSLGGGSDDGTDMNYESFNNNNNGGGGGGGALIFPDFRDGSSDSDSSAILNEDNSPNAAISSSGIVHHHHHHPFSISSNSSILKFNSNSSSSSSISGCFQFSSEAQKVYQPQFVKTEEHNFFGGEESCNFFSDEQAPTLQWYCPDPWNNNV